MNKIKFNLVLGLIIFFVGFIIQLFFTWQLSEEDRVGIFTTYFLLGLVLMLIGVLGILGAKLDK